MLTPYELTLHGLTLRQLADAGQLAEITAQDVTEVTAGLERAVAGNAVLAARGSFMITPAGREFLDGVYPSTFAGLRADTAVTEAMDAFETGVNKQVLELTTQWQTAQDETVVGKLGRVVDKTYKVLRPLAAFDPLVDRFLDRIGTALTRVESGETDYVSGVRVDSVHTVWFQMHEHILRLTGRERPE